MLPTRIIISAIALLLCLSANAFQQPDSEKLAVSVNKFILFPDSSYYNHSNIAIAEGETFELLEETALFHEDDSQTQKYKWFKIKLKTGQIGWVFGNNIAVFDRDAMEKLELKDQKGKLSYNYYNSKVWAASIFGYDAQTSVKTPYLEKYLVFTNSARQSRYIQIGREQVEGKSWVGDVQLIDLNQDSYHEIVVQLNSKGAMNETVNQYLEIFTMKHDAVINIFSEKINLGRASQNIAPINRKFLELEDGSIRVAFLDYFDCSDSFGGSCMEYVTYTYAWDKSTNRFETLYEPSRTKPVLKPKADNLHLYPGPGLFQTIGTVDTRERLKVIGQEEKILRYGDQMTKKVYFLVETFDGKRGYIESKDVDFVENDYSKSLNKYYHQPAVNVAKFDADIMAVEYNLRQL